MGNVDPSRIVHGLKRKVEDLESSTIPKNAKLMDIPINNLPKQSSDSVSILSDSESLQDSMLAENCQSDVTMLNDKTLGITKTDSLIFTPCNAKEQSSWCSLLNLPLVVAHNNFCEVSQVPLGIPLTLYKTVGDGNCLFRALSYLITGRQVYHHIVRTKIVQHMINIESALRPHLNSSLRDYLACSGMRNQSVWGTDIEILTASSLLATDIFVYTKVGAGYKWQKFSHSMLGEDLPHSKGAMYLQNTAGVHYDVVINVTSEDYKFNCEDDSCCTKLFSGSQQNFGSNRQTEKEAKEISTQNKHLNNETLATQHNFPFLFTPYNAKEQSSWCSLLNLPLVVTHDFSEVSQVPLGIPLTLYKTIGDGNCLFRALSYLITGRQVYHLIVRTKIVQHMINIESALRPHLNSSLRDYLACSGMRNKSVWGTDIEILTASSLLATDIFVYTKVGSIYKWQMFSQSMLGEDLPQNTCKGSIYLQNTAGVHYDAVINVSSDEVDVSNTYAQYSSSSTNCKKDELKPLSTCNQKSAIADKGSNVPDKSETFTHTNHSSARKLHRVSAQKSIRNFKSKQSVKTGNKNSCGEKANKSSTYSSEMHDKNHENISTVHKNTKQHLSNFHKSIQFTLYQCQICHEAWPLKSNPKSPTTFICQRCKADKGTPKKFSACNYMIPSPVPKELQGLTQIEEMLISRALPIMKVYVKPGGQRGYSGHCINLPQKVTELAQSLPKYPKDIPLIVVTMNGKDNSFKDVIVRRNKVEQALLWLVKNNRYYKDIKFDSEALKSLPTDGIPVDLQTIETELENCDEFDQHEANDKISDNESDEQLFVKETETSSFLPQNENGQLENDAIQNKISPEKMDWPRVQDDPLNEYNTPYLATLAFPTLFPDGNGDPTNPSLFRDVSFVNRIQHLLKFAECINEKWHFRFASHPRFSYWALNLIQRKRCLQQTSVFFKQNPGEAHLTFEELQDMARNNTSKVFMTKLSRYVGNITGSSAYWHRVQQDLKTIIAYKGSPTIFFTLSSADMHWPELHKLFSANVDNLTPADRRKNVIDNPHIVDWFFTKRLESFLKHWLYNCLGAEWHWYRYEFQARGSIHCHGIAKLKNDPGLCSLTEKALQGFLAEKSFNESGDPSLLYCITEGKKASDQVCQYVDTLMSTYNPCPPESNLWTKPNIHPCKKQHKDINESDWDSDYADLLNTVQRHTHCSTRYCLRYSQLEKDLHCRFNYPYDLCNKTTLMFEPVHTKDKTSQFKAKIVTKRNDARLNNHQRIQLQGWRANCDIQAIIDHHACVEYLSKYAAKGEPRSQMLTNTFNSVIKGIGSSSDSQKAMKKVVMKTLGQRDFSAQETMHLLLSLKLYSTTFTVLPVSLNGSRRIKSNVTDPAVPCTNDCLLDTYAKRLQYQNDYPDIQHVNLVEFVERYKLVKGKLVNQSPNIVPRIFPNFSPNPKGENYSLYCKYQLLKYKPWNACQSSARNIEDPTDHSYVDEWHNYLSSPSAQTQVPNWEHKLQHVIQNVELDTTDESNNFQENRTREEWMILSDFHNSNTNNIDATKCLENHLQYSEYWHLHSDKYTQEQIAEMPSWIKTQKNYGIQQCNQHFKVDINLFNDKQRLAYDIMTTHSDRSHPKEPLRLILNGVAGTGKSYLINAVHNYLTDKCVVTATTGKASYNVSGVTIHSYLRLPVSPTSRKDLSGQALTAIQERLLHVDYLLIDEYSMLGQTTMGWIDRRCRQATGKHEVLFGGKSVILIGDPGQIPPVGDKPLYHSKPSTSLGEQGYCAYQMFIHVVILTVNQRVIGSDADQMLFRKLLSRLRNGKTTQNDWQQLLDRQPSRIPNLDEFKSVTRLYYPNEEVAKYNYDRLVELKQPIAEVYAKHSSEQARKISAQEIFGLQPKLLISRGAKVMLTMNLWPSVGLCNGSTGTVVDIIYETNHQPPLLPIAVVVQFDKYSGPSMTNMPYCVPIPPIVGTVNLANTVHERQQLPLTLAWALTIHKSQGMTLDRVWIDIGKKESTLGVTYVGISRVRNLSSLVIEPMTFERLQKIGKSESLRFRLNEEQRLKGLSQKTAKLYGK